VFGWQKLQISSRGKKLCIQNNFVFGWQKLQINFDHVRRVAFSRKFWS